MKTIPISASPLPGEAEILGHVVSDLNDLARKLVYADWLDDHDDPRAELIRIVEEMRRVPPYSDRFWELKPQRNALREQSPDEWLKTLRYATEDEPLFTHGIPAGWKERWRLIRELTERWHGIPMGDIGGHEEKIAEYESALGRKLPPSLREWIAYVYDAGRRVEFGMIQNQESQSHAISIYRNQFSVNAVPLDALSTDDPEVHGFLVTSTDYLPRYLAVDYESTSALFLHVALTDVACSAGSISMYTLENSELMQSLRDHFPKWTEFQDIIILEKPSMLIRMFRFPGPGRNVCVDILKGFEIEQFPKFLIPYLVDSDSARTGILSEERWLNVGD